MNNLLYKELRLTLHPTAFIFLALSAMLLIPNYPYYVTFFYTGLAIFFTCLNGRENHDISYTMNLPVRKKDIVRARFLVVVILQLSQAILAIPFAILRQMMPLPGNLVGMDANIAFFGLSFIMMGLFNLVFFHIYYDDVEKVGKAFGMASVVMGLYMLIMETLTHAVPFFKDQLDTNDPQHLVPKLMVLGTGLAFYAAATLLAYRRSVRTFEALDL